MTCAFVSLVNNEKRHSRCFVADRRVERSCCGETRTEFDKIEGILVF
jgi:hypothetical protein